MDVSCDSCHGMRLRYRGGTGSKFSGNKLFRESLFWFEPYGPLIIFEPSSSLEYSTKAHRLGQDFGPGNIRYWAYLLRAYLQAQAFGSGWVPVPALLDTVWLKLA